MSTGSTILLRKPAVLARTGFGTTMLYERIKSGLFTGLVRIGPRLSAWPESEVESEVEVEAINFAIVAGKSETELRELILQLEHARR